MKTLNQKLLISLINKEIEQLEILIVTEKSENKFDTYFNHEMKINRLKEQLELLTVDKSKFLMMDVI